MGLFSAEVRKGNILYLCFSSQTVNCPLYGLFNATFPLFLSFQLVIALFKTASKCTANVLSSHHKHKKAMLCLMEKMCVLYKLCSGMNSI